MNKDLRQLLPAIEVKIIDPRLKEWGIPDYQSTMAAGIDLYACIEKATTIKSREPACLISSGMAIHINDPYITALIVPRSGLAHKKGLVLGNSLGVIDADYSGTIFMSIWNRNTLEENIIIKPGERIAQMIFIPIVRPELNLVENFSHLNQRGENGFGSTGLVQTEKR